MTLQFGWWGPFRAAVGYAAMAAIRRTHRSDPTRGGAGILRLSHRRASLHDARYGAVADRVPRRGGAAHDQDTAGHNGPVSAADRSDAPGAGVLDDGNEPSHGRFMPGVGRGVRDPEHELFGSELATMREVDQEVLAILQQGLSTGRITHRSERFQYDDEPMNFEMVQKPYPRFWYAGNLQRGGAGNERPGSRDARHGGAILADLGGRAGASRSAFPGRRPDGRFNASSGDRRDRRGGGVARPTCVRRLCGAFPLHRSEAWACRKSRRVADARKYQLRDDARGGTSAGRFGRYGARCVAALPRCRRAEA